MFNKRKKTKIFLGGYINKTNAQNLNCLSLAKYLDKEKYDIYTLSVRSGTIKNKPIDGVYVFHSFYPNRIIKYLGYFWGIFRCDVAYLPKGEIWKWNRFWLKVFNKRSFITVESIVDERVFTNVSKYYGSAQNFIAHYKSFDKVFSITKYMQDYNFKYRQIETEDRVLYLGAEIELFLNEQKNISELKAAILIGTDLVRKGIDDYFEIASAFPGIVFHVVGTGNKKIEVNSELKKRKLNNIIYHGGLEHKQLVKLLEKIDLHILPSRTEGFPKVILETAAAGIPSLVYSDYGAQEWMTDRENGFVVHTLDQMKNTIQELLQHPDILQKASRNSSQLAINFDWKELIKNWENVIDSLVNDKIAKK